MTIKLALTDTEVELPEKFQVLQVGEIHTENKTGEQWQILCFIGECRPDTLIKVNVETGCCFRDSVHGFAKYHTFFKESEGGSYAR